MKELKLQEGSWVEFQKEWQECYVGYVARIKANTQGGLYIENQFGLELYSLSILKQKGVIKLIKDPTEHKSQEESMEKVLGKIKHITFGIGGYNEAMLGYDIEFSLDGGERGVSVSNGFFDFNRIKHTEHCKWSIQDREDAAVIMLKDLSDILAKAKVRTVDKLVNIPVEVTIESNTIKSWRVLEEVL